MEWKPIGKLYSISVLCLLCLIYCSVLHLRHFVHFVRLVLLLHFPNVLILLVLVPLVQPTDEYDADDIYDDCKHHRERLALTVVSGTPSLQGRVNARALGPGLGLTGQERLLSVRVWCASH